MSTYKVRIPNEELERLLKLPKGVSLEPGFSIDAIPMGGGKVSWVIKITDSRDGVDVEAGLTIPFDDLVYPETHVRALPVSARVET